MAMYHCVAGSVEGFIQQLAVSYISHGYLFYVSGVVPDGKDPRRVDDKLIERYGIDISKWTRARRKTAGLASVQYLRCRRRFVLLATHGDHPFFLHEATTVRDLRRVPLKVFGYALSSKRGHAHVRIEREEFKRLKAYFSQGALHRSASTIVAELQALPFEPYAPVRRQLLQLVRAINRVRRQRGFELLPYSVLRFRRRIVRPFEATADAVLTADGVPSASSSWGGRWGEFERGGGGASAPSH
jgi:hypothetical protein